MIKYCLIVIYQSSCFVLPYMAMYLALCLSYVKIVLKLYHTCVYVYMYVCTCTCTYYDVYNYMYINTCIYVCTLNFQATVVHIIHVRCVHLHDYSIVNVHINFKFSIQVQYVHDMTDTCTCTYS